MDYEIITGVMGKYGKVRVFREIKESIGITKEFWVQGKNFKGTFWGFYETFINFYWESKGFQGNKGK